MTQSTDLEYEVYTKHSIENYKMSSISNVSVVPENKEIKLEFDDNLTVDEMAERINNLLVISASVLIIIKFSLIVGIINSLPRIPRIVQPRIPVEANRTSKLKIC